MRILDFGLKIVFKQALLYAVILACRLNHLQSRTKPVNNKINNQLKYIQKVN